MLSNDIWLPNEIRRYARVKKKQCRRFIGNIEGDILFVPDAARARCMAVYGSGHFTKLASGKHNAARHEKWAR